MPIERDCWAKRGPGKGGEQEGHKWAAWDEGAAGRGVSGGLRNGIRRSMASLDEEGERERGREGVEASKYIRRGKCEREIWCMRNKYINSRPEESRGDGEEWGVEGQFVKWILSIESSRAPAVETGKGCFKAWGVCERWRWWSWCPREGKVKDGSGWRGCDARHLQFGSYVREVGKFCEGNYIS
jgi:hypothetical protein